MQENPSAPTPVARSGPDYVLLRRQAAALAAEEKHMVPLLSNLSALLMEGMEALNWAGFYLVTGDGNLVLGPFQGKPEPAFIFSADGAYAAQPLCGMRH